MRIAVFILFFLFSIQVMSQNKQFVESIGWYGKKLELHTVLNRTKQSSCSFLVSSDSIRAFVFTGALKLMRQFSVPRRPDTKLLGGFMRDSSVYMFTEASRADKLYCSALNVITGNVSETDIPFDPENEKTVTHISAGNHFLYVTASNKRNELIVYDFINGRAGTTLRYQFADDQWKELTRPGFLGRNVRLIKIEQDGDLNLDNLAKKNKLYLNNESLMLVMNNHIDSTRIVNFDLKQQKVSSWVVDHNPGFSCSKNFAYSDNSFLFRNKLYYVRATSDSLQVQIVDPYSGAVSKSFSAQSDKEITWKNTAIIDEENGGSQKGVRNRENTRQLLRKMIRDTAVIMVRPYGNDQIEVVIGAYARKTAYMSGGAPGVAGAALGAAAAGAYVGPQYISPAMSSGGFYRSTWTKSMHFKMLLNADYSNAPGEPVSTMAERIERYTANLRTPPEQENIFVTNGQYYYAWYDKGERKLVVMKF
ncbi:hypothetical protein [Niastella sp. OAS944]|uniref:hypothetical protein n=1 Tax=Niastella sp. OAS944 TaxID=2664089 RepID=UPI00347E6C28|nr:hypothetical protein [Chitinophagaceae bacterium OAS944]